MIKAVIFQCYQPPGVWWWLEEASLARLGGMGCSLSWEGDLKTGTLGSGFVVPISANNVPEKMGTDYEDYVQFLPQKSIQIFSG